MAEENFTLTTFYESWKNYQNHIKASVASLTAEQWALRASSDLRTVGEIANHIVGCRAGWFNNFLKEDGGAEAADIATWDETGTPPRPPADIVKALDLTWTFMMDCLTRWTPEDMAQTFEDDWGEQGVVHLSRAWVVWHVLEHDLHHGGELSLTLGMHGIPADFPG
jgi:uncharacterized damage-inducible protein DinB